MNPRPTRTRAAALAALAALALAGCSVKDAPADGTTPAAADSTTGSTTDDTTSTETTTDDAGTSDDAAGTAGGAAAGGFPVTVDAENGEVTIEKQPQRIVSISPSATEILFAIGAGDQVVAADSYSTYPENAPVTDLSGYDPNVEAIVGYEPDLVLAAHDANELVASLEKLDIPVLVNGAPADIEGGYDIAAGIGLATGHPDEAAELISTMRSEMDKAFAAAPKDEKLRVYHELDGTFFSASSSSFIGSVYAQMGAENIADEADTEGTGYPQLTEEAIIAADPQLIVVTDDVSYTAEDIANRPGWSEVSAVKNGNIVMVDADIASRWGPRLPQLVDLVAGALNEVKEPAGR